MSDNDNGEPPGPQGISGAERAAFEKRAASIGDKLDAVKGRRPGAKSRSESTRGGKGAAMARAMRVSTDLIGGIVVGGLIGYGLDYWLGNAKPWFFIVFFLLGACAGILNVVRAAAKEKTPPAPAAPVDQDEN